MNRLLHEPTLRLRTMTEGRSHGRLQIMRELFGLEGAPEGDEQTADAVDRAASATTCARCRAAPRQ